MKAKQISDGEDGEKTKVSKTFVFCISFFHYYLTQDVKNILKHFVICFQTIQLPNAIEYTRLYIFFLQQNCVFRFVTLVSMKGNFKTPRFVCEVQEKLTMSLGELSERMSLDCSLRTGQEVHAVCTAPVSHILHARYSLFTLVLNKNIG